MVPVTNRKNYSAILTPKNCHRDTINSVAIRKFREETPIITLYRADTVSNEDGSDSIQNNLYPTELLNSLNVQRFPPELKVHVRAENKCITNVVKKFRY